MKLKPIRTEADHRAALAEAERLLEARPGTVSGDRLEVLITLIEAYEREHHAMPAPDPVEAIRYTLESRGLAPSDLVPLLGSKQDVEAVLTRKRRLTLGMMRSLSRDLGISADILIQPYRLKAA